MTSLGVDHLIFEGGGGGGLEELRKKFPAELSQRKKKSCNTDGQEKKCLHKLRGKKKFRTIPGNALWKGCSPGNLGNYPAPFRE